MKPFVMLFLAFVLVYSAEVQAQVVAADDQYFDVYTLILKADTLSAKGKTDQARSNYVKAEVALKKLQEDYPLWNTKVIRYRLDYLNAKISSPAMSKKPAAMPASPAKMAPAVSAESAAPADAGEPVTMKIKWVVGKRYVDRLTLGVTAQVTPPGQPQAQTGELKLSQDFAISALKERDNGGRDLQVELLDTFFNLTQSGQTILSFDSKHPPAADNPSDPIGPMLKHISGAKLRFLTDGSGKIESVEGLDDFIKTIGGTDAPTSADLLKSGPSNVMSDLRDMQSSVSFFPDSPVKVGDTWSKMSETPGQDLGAVSGNMNYSFTGWEQHDGHKCAVVEFKGSLGTKPAGGNAPSPLNIQAGISGKYWFDPELGMVVEASANPDIDGSGMLALKMTVHANYKLVELADIAK